MQKRMKRRLYSAVAAMLMALAATAQVTTAYDVSGSIGPYTEISGGTAIGLLPEGEALNETVLDGEGHAIAKDTVVTGMPIGFDFKFNNQAMNRFAIGANGYLLLGRDRVEVNNSARNAFNLMSNDDVSNALGAVSRGKACRIDGTEISYRTDGQAPNRTLTVQYKNLGIDVGNWDPIYVTVQLQIRLHEDGRAEMVFSNWRPDNEDMPTYYSMKVFLKGDGDDRLQLGGSYTDFTLSTGDGTSMTWNNDNYPADGQTYTFTPPADCEKPAAQPTGLTLQSYSTRVEGSFTPAAGADHYLVLVTDGQSMDEMPADGVQYAAGDSIGNALVVAYDTLTAFSTPDVLSGAGQYTVCVMAANSLCMYGPKYLTETPLQATTTTLPDAPASVTAEASDIDAMTVGIRANANGDRVLVAMTTEPTFDQFQQITGIGAFGTPTGNLAAGDEIEGGGTVVYAGEARDGISVTGLNPNTPYYLMAWSIGPDGQCSSTSATATTATGGEVPYSPDFSKMQQNVAPMGWQTDEDGFNLGQEYNGPYNISCRVMQADHTNGVEHSITSPWIKLADGSNRVLMDVNMTCYQGRVNAPYNNWEANDTVLVQVSADGEQFTTIYGMGPATRPYIADLDSYVTIRMPFDGFAGDKVKVRITWKTFTNPTFTIKNFTVEEKKDCDYPIDLHTVDGSVAGNVASIDWTRQGNENEWELRYKPAGSEEWSQTVQVLNKPFTFADLPGLTYIDVQLRAKCDASTHSEWSDTLTFRTGYTMPFTERFDATELPYGWEPRLGVLATPTVFDDGARTAWQFSSSSFMRGLMFSPSSLDACNEWLVMPTLDMDDGSANYVLTLYLTNMQQGQGTDDSYAVVVSRDGETFNEADVVSTFAATELPQAGASGSISVPLRGYRGMVRPALYISSTDGRPATLKLDSVAVTPTCPQDVSAITLSDTTETSVKVSWQTSAERSYIFIRRAGDTAKPYIETEQTQYEFTSLEPRTDYEIGITKVCEPGDTARVTITRVTTLAADGCPMPEGLRAEPQKYAIALSWNGEGQSYNVRYRRSGTEAWTQRATTGTSFVISGLDDATAYDYAVQSQCSTLEADTSAYTPTATATTLAETCFPPTEITVSPGYNSATATWAGEAESYRLAYARAGSDEWTEAAVTGNTYTIEGLEPQTDYRLRMRSFCSATDSSLWSDEVAFATTALPECVTPFDLAVSNISGSTAMLSWQAGEGNLRWNLHWRKSDASAWTEVDGLTATSYELAGLEEGASYLWSVMAECELNESRWATQNRFTTTLSGIGTADISGVSVFVKGGVLNIVNPERAHIGSIRIYNSAGQMVKAYDVDTAENVFIPLGSTAGQVLVIKIAGRDSERTIKVGI